MKLPETAAQPRRPIAMTLVVLSGVLLFGFVISMTLLLPTAEAHEIPTQYVLSSGVDAWDAGRAAYDAGDLEKAVAYWRQVPEDHRSYSRSLRYIGWEVYAEKLGEPRKALNYVNRCALNDPFDGNTWQDLGRTYAAVFGIPVR